MMRDTLINKKSKKNEYLQYFLVFLLIALSGFPFFTAKDIYLVVATLFTIFIFLFKGLKIDKYFLITLFILFLLVAGQTLIFNFFSLSTTLGLVVRWTFPFLVIKLLQKEFINKYIKVMYILTVISFFFYFISLIIPGFDNFLLLNISPLFTQESNSDYYQYIPNILIYTLNPSAQGWFEVFRNCGPFWEPGAFAGYLILAILFNFVRNRKILNKYNIIFFIGLCTTFSTAGFLAFSLFLSAYFVFIRKKRIGLIFVLLILFFAYTAYSDLPIINFKINKSVEQLDARTNIYSNRTRILSAILDLEDAINYPVFGRGRNEMTRFGTSVQTFYEHRNNGDTDFLVKYGIPFTLFYFFTYLSLFKNWALINNSKSIYGLIALTVILIIGFAETYFQQSVFIGLYFLSFYAKEN